VKKADTIAAIATAAGRGGVGVIRISGPAAHTIGLSLSRRDVLKPRRAHFATLVDGRGDTIDTGLVLYFKEPHSFTGEDVVELQAHGSPIVLGLLMTRVLELGARQARAGEFSERAFLNGRIDLTQAEAIADLISAQSTAQARAAIRSLDGVFGARVRKLQNGLEHLRLHLEAAIDFPEEEIDFLADPTLLDQNNRLLDMIDALLIDARRGQRLRDGLHVVLVGKPNAGKSSLMNALAGRERAIVTDIAGTTRDTLIEEITLDGASITLVDTAGIRDSADPIEQEGVRRARAELERADLALIVLAPGDEPDIDELRATAPAGIQALIVRNKCDLGEPTPIVSVESELHISATVGLGMDTLRDTLRRQAGVGEGTEGSWSARARHVDALERVKACTEAARSRLLIDRAGELAAEELRRAQEALSEITGEYKADDLLGAIFSSFCIGK